MRLATIISLSASAVLGLGALVVAKFWLPEKEAKQEVVLVNVVAAAKPIPFGARLNEKNLTVVKMPAESVPVGSYRTVKEVIKMDGGAPVALAAIAPREAILPAKLSGAGAKASMAAMISPGMRAYTIRVADVAGGGGHVLPGDHVDVLLARTISHEGGEDIEVSVVLQNVRVLGINLNSNQSSTEKATPKHATVEVTVEDAGRLQAASQVGSLSVALRRSGATEIEPIRPIRTRDLRQLGPARSVPSAPPPPAYNQPTPVSRPAAPKPRSGGLVVVNGLARSVASDGDGA